MLGARDAYLQCTLEDGAISARASVVLGFVFHIAASGESYHSSKLFFHQAFIPQLRNC